MTNQGIGERRIKKLAMPHWVPEELDGEGWLLVLTPIHIRIDSPETKGG